MAFQVGATLHLHPEIHSTVSGLDHCFRAAQIVTLHGFFISIDFDFENVRLLLLVSPLAAGDPTNMSINDLYNRDQVVTFVSAFTLRHIHCPSNLIFTESRSCTLPLA